MRPHRRLPPHAPAQGRIEAALVRFMQFETPFWKLARFDTDWRVREAAQRFYVTLCMVHGDDIEVAEDSDLRTMRFYEAADKNPLKRDVLRWYPPLRRLGGAGPATDVAPPARSSHRSALESLCKFLLTQAEGALAPWIVPLSGAYSPSGGVPHDLLTMLDAAARTSAAVTAAGVAGGLHAPVTVCVLGEAGSGKSIVLHQEMVRAWRDWKGSDDATQLPPITLRIELSGLTRAKAPSMVRDALKSCKATDAFNG